MDYFGTVIVGTPTKTVELLTIDNPERYGNVIIGNNHLDPIVPEFDIIKEVGTIGIPYSFLTENGLIGEDSTEEPNLDPRTHIFPKIEVISHYALFKIIIIFPEIQDAVLSNIIAYNCITREHTVIQDREFVSGYYSNPKDTFWDNPALRSTIFSALSLL